MKLKPIIASPGDGVDVKDANWLPGRFRLSRAIVLDHGSLVGITALRDLVQACLTGDDPLAPGPEESS